MYGLFLSSPLAVLCNFWWGALKPEQGWWTVKLYGFSPTSFKPKTIHSDQIAKVDYFTLELAACIDKWKSSPQFKGYTVLQSDESVWCVLLLLSQLNLGYLDMSQITKLPKQHVNPTASYSSTDCSRFSLHCGISLCNQSPVTHHECLLRSLWAYLTHG